MKKQFPPLERAFSCTTPQNATRIWEFSPHLVDTARGGMKFSAILTLTIVTIKTQTLMSNLLYLVAVVLVIAWLVGFVGFHTGGIIHVLLVIAIIAILIRVIQGRKVI